MKRIISISAFFLSFFLLFTLHVKAYTVDDIPMVHLQNRMRYVSNPDHILSEQAVTAMDTILYNLENQKGIQVAVFAVREISGGSVFDFAQQLGEKYGIGQQGKDNGLIVLLVTNERKIRIHTGYGLEGVLPDAITKRIQSRYMVPFFKNEDWDEGMLAGIKTIRTYLNDYDPENPQASHQEEGFPIELLIVLLVFGIIPVIIWTNNWWKRRCPKCHKHTLHEVSSHVITRYRNSTVEEVVMRCSHCHAQFSFRRQRGGDDDDHHHTTGSGPFWGGFMGGTFFGGRGGSSGGFGGGGSYGGGDFGGGGSESDF